MRLPRTWHSSSYAAEPIALPVQTASKSTNRVRWSELRHYLLAALQDYPETREKLADKLAGELGLTDSTEIQL